MKKIFLTVITITILLFGINMLSANAANVATGTCGDNLTWVLDDTGTLTISGTGVMTDYSPENYAPWCEYNRMGIKTLIINNAVSSIGSWAFSGCVNLESVVLADSIVEIGDWAFSECQNLTKISLPSKLKTIDDFAFYSCDNLTDVVVHKNITNISEWAFMFCYKLDSIQFNGSQSQWNLIPGTEALNAVSLYLVEEVIFDSTGGSYVEGQSVPVGNKAVEPTPPTKSGYTFGGWFTDVDCTNKFDFNTLIDKNITLYAKWFDIVANGTCGDNLTWTLDDTGTLIISGTGDMPDAWSYNNGAYVSSGLPWQAYKDKIKFVVIENGATTIGKGAFKDCSVLSSVIIPQSVIDIGKQAFRNCTKLSNINVSHENSAYVSIDDVLFDKHQTTLIAYPAGKTSTSYIIPEGVTKIDDYAFSGCTSLIDVTIPDSVTSMGSHSFSDCRGLKNVYISDIVTWCSFSFGDYYSNPLYWGGKLYLSNQLVTELVIPEGVTKIGDYAFSGYTSLTSVTIPDSVTYIGLSAFSSCELLERVVLPDGIKTLDGFSYCSSLTSLTIPDSVTTIISGAFNSCVSLESLVIPESVKLIEEFAFDMCPLKYITYKGPKRDWDKIKIEFGNDVLSREDISSKVFYEKTLISYNLNGGTGTFPEQIKKTGEPIDLYNTIPQKSGCEFKGWSTTLNGDPEYSSGASYSGDKDAVLYAVWGKSTYEVTYDSNGGTGNIANSSHTYDVLGNLNVNTFIKTGYTFKGWATSRNGSVEYNDGASIKNLSSEPNGNVTLYAVWEANYYTVSYNANGGSGSMNISVHQYDESQFLNANRFGRTGYEFIGWDIIPTGAGKYVDGSVVKNLTSEQNGELTLYAIWKANEYTVTYNANGGSGIVRSSNHTYDQPTNLSVNNFIRIGYIFRGWSKTSSGTVAYNDEQSVTNLTPINNDNITLYAVWEPGCELYVNGNKVKFDSLQPIYGKIIVGLYSSFGKMKDLQYFDAVDGINVTFSNLSTGDYTKVMCWESITSAKPMLGAQTIVLK